MVHQNCKRLLRGVGLAILTIDSLFMHGGHTSRVSDFSFNRNDPWLMVSADEVNLLQIWKTTDSILGNGKADVPLNELEK
jgi:histone-binding protein RBBP4